LKPYIKSVTTINLEAMSFDDMLAALAPYLLEEVPEGTAGMDKVDPLIGRFANVYAYLSYLWAFAQAVAGEHKQAKRTAEYDDMMRKRDALYRFLRAVELKWQAASRMVTVAIAIDEDPHEQISYQSRKSGWDRV